MPESTDVMFGKLAAKLGGSRGPREKNIRGLDPAGILFFAGGERRKHDVLFRAPSDSFVVNGRVKAPPVEHVMFPGRNPVGERFVRVGRRDGGHEMPHNCWRRFHASGSREKFVNLVGCNPLLEACSALKPALCLLTCKRGRLSYDALDS